MAGIADYINRQNATSPEEQQLVKNLSKYTANQEVLAALGQKDPTKPLPKFLDTLLTPLSVPGNLLRAGAMELTGLAKGTKLEDTSGVNEFLSLLSGRLKVGVGDIAPLQTQPGENVLSRAMKLGAAFAGDVATDPLSYVGAPAAISRKTAVQILQNDILTEGNTLLSALTKASPKGEKLVDELASASKIGWAGREQELAGIAPKQGDKTAANLVDQLPKEYLANLHLAEYLGRGLYGGGRQELITRLASITGSREVATQIYKDLIPEQVKGGVVLSGLSGNPITDAGGNMVRLTEGTGDYAGATMLNKARLAAGRSIPATFVKKYFSGQAGEVWDAATKSVKEELVGKKAKDYLKKDFGLPPYAEAIHKDRILDYTIGKKAASERKVDVNKLQNKARAVAETALQERNRFEEQGNEALARYDKAVENAFFAPWDTEIKYLTPEEAAGREAGIALRNHIGELFTLAKLNGIDVGQIGDFNTYSPFMLDEASYKRLKATDAGYMLYDEYNPTLSRQSMIRYFEDPEIAKKYGFPLDPENPNVVALDARNVNKIWESEGDVRRAETDPLRVFTTYAEKWTNKIATKRFLDTLTRTGIGLQDNPSLVAKLTGKDAAILQGIAVKTLAPMSKIATENLQKSLDEISALINPKTFNELKTEIATIRAGYEKEYNALSEEVKQTVRSLRETEDSIDNLSNTKEIGKFLEDYASQYSKVDFEKIQTDKVYRALKAKVYRLKAKGATEEETRSVLLDRMNSLIKSLQTNYPNLPIMDFMLSSGINKDLLNVKSNIDDITRQIEEYTVDSDAQFNLLSSLRANQKELTKINTEALQQQYAQYEELVRKEANLNNELKLKRADRNNAYQKYNATKRELALEGKTTIDELVYSYKDAKVEYENARNQRNAVVQTMRRKKMSKEEISAFVKEEAPRIKELKTLASAKRKFLYDILATTEKNYGGIVSKYAKSVLAITERLTAEQVTAFRYMRNEGKLQDIIQTISESRTREETFQAFDDLYKTYMSYRGAITDDIYKTYTKDEMQIVKKLNSKFVGGAIKKDKTASAYGKLLADEGMIVSAASPGTRNLFVNSGVKKWLDDLYATSDNPSSWKRYVNDVLDPLLQLWKQTVTVGRGPGFVATNLAGGLFMNYQGGVKATDMQMSYTVLREMRQTLAQVKKEFPDNPLSINEEIATQRLNSKLGDIKFGDTDLATAFQTFYAAGAFNDTETHFGMQQLVKGGLQTDKRAYTSTAHMRKDYLGEDIGTTERVFRKGIDFAATNAVQRALNDMNQTAEIFMRFGAFLSGYRDYGNYQSAMDKVYLLHFDYSDLTEAEQAVRRIAPFYTWTRNNIPAQLRSIVMQPGKIQRAMYLNQEFQDKFGADGEDGWVNQVLPEYMQNSSGFYSIFNFGDNTLGFINKMPYEDVNKLFNIGQNGIPNVNTNQLAQMLGPVGTPLQIIGGANYLTGQPLSQDVQVGDYYRLFGLVPGVDVKSTQDGTKISGSSALALRNLIPILGVGERTFSAVNSLTANKLPAYVKDLFLSQSTQKAGAANLLNTTGLINLIGLSATMGTPKGMSGNIYGKINEQQAVASAAARDLNIDTAWIREQLKTYTPQQVAVMIQSGQAKKKENAKITESDWTKYRDAIATLNSP